jgi:hypothetical protein
MNTAAKEIAGVKGRWHFAIWLFLVAFTLQSYVVQIHFHDAAPTAISKVLANTGHGKSPADNSPLDCPFCQAALSSAFALFATPLVFISADSTILATLNRPASASYDTMAHIWRSRAPPHK